MEFKNLFSQDEKLNQIAYLADMFGLLNQLNISLQGPIIDLYDKIKSFQMKVDLWLSKLKLKNTYMFPVLAACLEKNNNVTGLNESLLSEIKVHLLCLKEELSRYFSDISNKLFPLVKSPFTFDFGEMPEIAQE
jgi:iron-sulfur cluster repair protein YtfE (RIC family)